MGERLLCVSVDLDGLSCYHAIHGLSAPGGPAEDLHYTAGLRNHLDLFESVGVTATLFAVGEDALRPACGEVLGDAASRGHEVANHTWSHPYDFSRFGSSRMQEQIRQGGHAILKATGREPVGFRAPGYHIDDRVLRILEQLGYSYDASLLPSGPYYAAKLAVMASMALRGRRSRSIAGGPGMILAPRRPYRTGSRYFRKGRGFVEIPCSVVPVLRLPFIGTALILAGPSRARLAARAVALGDFVSLELHAIDLMDEGDDALSALRGHQPDLGISLLDRRRTLESVLETLLGSGFRSVTLAEAASILF